MILPEDAPVGMDFTDYLGMSDTVIDCEITPNRPDCLSMTGMARRGRGHPRRGHPHRAARREGRAGSERRRPRRRDDRRPRALPALHRARGARRQDWPLARVARPARCRRRRALDQQRRGRDQLRDVPHRPAAPRLRPGQAHRARRQAPHRGPRRARRREARDARRPGARAHARHVPHHRRRSHPDRPRRRHGRPRLRDHGGDRRRPSRERELLERPHLAHLAATSTS